MLQNLEMHFPAFPTPFNAFIGLAAMAVLSIPLADAQAQGATGRAVSFRQTPIDVQAVERTVESRVRRVSATTLRPIQVAESGSRSEDELIDQRAALDAELRLLKSKREAALRRAEVQAAIQNSEQADKAAQDAEDIDARIEGVEAQLSALDGELAASNQPTPSAGLPGHQGADAGPDVILPGENIEVFVKEDSTFNGRHQIRRGGYIILEQVGRIYVAGKTLPEAEKAIRVALESSQLRRATVLVERLEGVDVETGPVVYLSGAFKSPRPYRIPSGTAPTLVSTILSCGGVTDKADLTRVKVMRIAAYKGVVEEVNVKRILEGAGLSGDIRLNDGDVVMIPATSENIVYFTGNVQKPGTHTLTPGERLSAYAAIISRGGFSRFANLKRVYVLRETSDGTKAKIPVNVIAIQKGQQPDISLEGNDIIVVPEKFFSF
jgi:protein involved in polysaccharide export with SLBB domain